MIKNNFLMHFTKLIIVTYTLLASQISVAGTLPTLQAADEFDIQTYRGQLVYLDFWASWCPPCRTSIPWLNRMQAKYRDQGLVIIGINNDDNLAERQAFLQQVPIDFKLVADPQRLLAKRYRTTGLPYSLLIAPDGRIVGTHHGFAKEQQPQLEHVIKRTLHRYKAALTPPAHASTQSVQTSTASHK